MSIVFHVKPVNRTMRFLIALLILSSSSGCVATRDINPISGHKRFYGYTWEEELKIGRESDPQIIAQYGLYDNEQLARYVEHVGNTVLQFSHLRRPGAEPKFRNLAFHFRLLDSPVVNAFALPGGYVYVTRGLLAHLENEAQLAVVLGHEIGHVAGRHASKRAASQAFYKIGLLSGAALGQGLLGGNAAQQVLSAGGQGMQLLFLRYGRNDEREADDVGVEYASMAGYKSSEAAKFFDSLKRINAQSDQHLPSFMSTHPDPGEREQTIRHHAEVLAKQMPMNKVGGNAFLDQIDGIVLGENPRQGFAKDGVFYHPDLKFRFPVPEAFQVINQPTQVVLVNKSQNAILLLSIENDAKTSQAAAEKFKAKKGVRVERDGSIRISGLLTRFVEAEVQTQDGQPARLDAYFIEYGGNVYAFMGYTLSSLYDTYKATFANTIKGFAVLTDPKILNTQPTRLHVMTVGKAAAFSSFVSNSNKLPQGWDTERMAILNQVRARDQIRPGMRLKVIQ